MDLIKPFCGIRPQADFAQQVVAPPYDVVNREEATALAADKPYSFLHVSKPEITLPDIDDCYADEVYQRGAENLQKLINQQILMTDDKPGYYLYQMETDELLQTGIVAAISAAAYDAGNIRKHELTRPQKEQDRVKLMQAQQAQISPVLLTFRSDEKIDHLLNQLQELPVTYQVKDTAGVTHRLWHITNEDYIEAISQDINALDCLYVADGHHRSAAASSIGQDFLGVLLPYQRLHILSYNRIIHDLGDIQSSDLLGAIEKNFSIEKVAQAIQPEVNTEIGMYIDKQWYRLTYSGEINRQDPQATLPVTILHDNIIAPLLKITDVRQDKRIDFVGGSRGLNALQEAVNSGTAALAFSVFPTTMEQLLAIADQQQIMPPKSTWFEPKLVDGLISMAHT